MNENNVHGVTTEETLPMVYQPDKDFLLNIIYPSDFLEDIEHGLRGEFKYTDDNGNSKWVKKGKRIINDTGIREILTTIGYFVTKDVIMSTLTEEEINNICNDINKGLAIAVGMNYQKWEVDLLTGDMIIRMIMSKIKINLNRALDGHTAEIVKPMIKRLEKVQTEPEKGKTSWFPFGGK